MGALFPRWSDTLLRVALIRGLVGRFLGLVLLMAWVRTPQITGQFAPLVQPSDFDHRHHVADDGIDCRYCHALVERSPSPDVPPTARCTTVHYPIWTSSPR